MFSGPMFGRWNSGGNLMQFRNYVNLFNQVLIDAYCLDHDPTYNDAVTLIPRTGTLVAKDIVFDYRYHGSGCTVLINDVIVSYDIDVLNNNEIKISNWKFNEFIRTYSKGTSLISTNDLDEIFFALVKKGVLIQRKEDVLVFNINRSYRQQVSERNEY